MKLSVIDYYMLYYNARVLFSYLLIMFCIILFQHAFFYVDEFSKGSTTNKNGERYTG